MSITLYYAHDPMCSWCYAFGPVWRQVLAQRPAGIAVHRLLGGLAPDTDQPMPQAMRARLQATWQHIEQSVPGTAFNFTFWTDCAPRRATHAACRAVIAARRQGEAFDEAMTQAIQQAYYRQARNPSDTGTLVELAGALGLDSARFRRDLDSPACARELQQEIAFCRTIHADSFPSLVLEVDGSHWPVAVDYVNAAAILDTLDFLLASA